MLAHVASQPCACVVAGNQYQPLELQCTLLQQYIQSEGDRGYSLSQKWLYREIKVLQKSNQ